MMPRFLFFDTETTGLPKDRHIPPHTQAHNWPDIVSLSWVVMTADKKMVKARHALIRPLDWTIPADSIVIHGITNAMANEDGHELHEVLEDFIQDMAGCQYVVSHSFSFDRNVVENAAIWKAKRPKRILWKNDICTAEEGKDITKIPFESGGYKYPRLAVLYETLTGHAPTLTLHNSLNDTIILAELFWHLPVAKRILDNYVHPRPTPASSRLRITLGS